MLGQAGEDITRNLIAGVPFAEKGRALINSYVNGDSYADELAKVRADRQAAERRAQSPAPLRKAPECCSPAARSQRASALLLGPSPMSAASSPTLAPEPLSVAQARPATTSNDQNIGKAQRWG
jgi:hypothetical protein